MEKVIFVDFDGTITKVDTCQKMVKTFARDGWVELNKLWEEKKLSTRECANRTFQLFDANLEELEKLIETIEIDTYFPEFVSMCQAWGYPIYILSDGYDLIIERVLKKYNINIPYYANKLLYDGQFSIECPYHNSECGICGTCKSTLMEKLRKNARQIVYIGDGYSDTCPASKADIVFAKGTLYKYCQEKGIKATHFDNFGDILRLVASG
ncbi:MAG: MtnX-like HAD-IB family phosphatase [Peptococcales bacterium]|jgi:2-hydroxy-3-keto-5-methylthiopentenyl-1-phosphate phosphatase